MLQDTGSETDHVKPLTTEFFAQYRTARRDDRKDTEPAQPFGLKATHLDEDGQEKADDVRQRGR